MAAWPDFYPCTCIAVDAQAYGSNNDRRQSEIQHDLPRLLDRAARSAGLDRAQWQIQCKGDEQLAVRPVDGKEPRLVDDYVRHIAAELRGHNAQRVPEARMRLRAVIHQGLVELADNGFAGSAVVATARLLNAGPLYDALAAHPRADLALLLSDEVFRATVAGGHTTLATSDFRRVDVRVKEFAAPAWLYVPEPGGPAAAPHGLRAADREEPEAAGGAGMSHEYRAEKINVTNVAGPVDARGAVFGFGGTGG
ncbi:hypothetical protein SALBM135S_02587 [Streptomyces alboniger]